MLYCLRNKSHERLRNPRKCINLRDVSIYDVETVGGEIKNVLNEKETWAVREKAKQLQEAWQNWLFADHDRASKIVALYNEKFNSIKPREFDGSNLNFPHMNPEITLNPHQRNAIAQAIYGGNTLFAHCVGAGKTFEMVATAMESKRFGVCNKTMICVPNHITEQVGSDFLTLYPSANILVATKKDFEAKNRRKLCAKIACGDYDAVIIGHSQLIKIPLNPKLERQHVLQQIEDITAALAEAKSEHGKRFTVKQMQKTLDRLDGKLRLTPTICGL